MGEGEGGTERKAMESHFCGDCIPELKFGKINTFYQNYLVEYTMGA